MSAGRLQVKIHSAGELVGAFQVFDAVAEGTAEMGHTASFFWQGKIKPAVFFTAIPFGLTSVEHMAWIYHGGGQKLWDELYGSFGIKPFMAGNTGMSMGGWYRKEIRSLTDLKGLKVRMPGLGGEIARRLGATPVSVAPPDIPNALQSGLIDGTEFLGPWSDLAAGFYKVAKNYYWPGFHEPNGTGEALVSAKAWAELPVDLKTIVENACAAENAYAVAETERENGRALRALVEDHGVKINEFPADVIDAAKQAAAEVRAGFGSQGELEKRLLESYEKVLADARGWSRVSTEAFLKSRNG
jgi:TRAP-type mannitol/chloroaromatic compound transport system substrate-binding protein